MLDPLLFIKPAITLSLAIWLSIACFNNIIDRRTNRILLSDMLSMKLIREDTKLGQGLLSRSWSNEKRVNNFLWLIVCIQALISLMLWISTTGLILSICHKICTTTALSIANFSLFLFTLLWVWFLCGGLWFGYWIKMGHVQIVHLLLFIVSLLSIIVINLSLG